MCIMHTAGGIEAFNGFDVALRFTTLYTSCSKAMNLHNLMVSKRWRRGGLTKPWWTSSGDRFLAEDHL